MVDGHIHIEQSEYTLEWLKKCITRAIERGIHEIWVLEHSYRFKEFVPMYKSIRDSNEYIDEWLRRKAGKFNLNEYINFISDVKKYTIPIKINFGLEVCYFKEYHELIHNLTDGKGFDFILGSVHFVNDFAFDHNIMHWNNMNIDMIYRKYFEISYDLVKSNLFDGIAHPDSIKLFGHKPSFSLSRYYNKLAQLLSSYKMYAEQNSGIFRRYPNTAELGLNVEFLNYLKRYNVRIITASDAHCPDDIGYKITELNNLILNS